VSSFFLGLRSLPAKKAPWFRLGGKNQGLYLRFLRDCQINIHALAAVK